MADSEEVVKVAKRLTDLLDRGLLPAGGPAEAAERLVERLQRPARVALLGLPGSGKSAVLNLLAGSTVVPESLRLPTIIVQRGNEPRMQCTLADGQIVTLPGSDLEKVLPLSPALITLDLDIPALGVISLLEVAAGPMEAEQRRAALWAGKRADIIIWCSTAYLPKEQLVWEGMPDTYKDNGFLLLTKIDLLGGREAAAGMHQRVMQRATGEFRQVLPISARDAHASTTAGKPIDRERFRESGAAALISTIKSRVHSAQQADLDTAELLISRHSEAVLVQQKPKFELRAVDSMTTLEPTEAALAAEAEALRRIAIAAAGDLDPAPTTMPEPEPVPDPETGNSEEEVTLSAADPVAKPELASKRPEIDLGTILETAPLPQPVEPENDPERLASPEPVGTEEPTGNDGPKTDPEASADSQPEIAGLVEPAQDFGDETDTPAVAIEAPAPQADTGDTSPRFAARLKRLHPEGAPAPTDLVPLRATWKSRTDAVNAMPIVPKPEPNRNPVQRQLPESLANEARLVGRPARPPEGLSGTGTSDDKPSASDGAATGQTEPSDVAASPQAEKSPLMAAEGERRAGRFTSVFGFRSKPEPENGGSTEPPPVEANEGLPEDLPQETDHKGPATEASDPERMPEGKASDLDNDDDTPNTVTDLEAVPSPEPGQAGLPLSERLGRPRRPTSVIRVSRLIQPQPDPLASLEPETASQSDPAERRGRPRIVPRVLAATAEEDPTQQVAPDSEKALLAEAVSLILARSIELSDQIDPDEKPPVDLILEQIGETVDRVMAIFSRAASPDLRRIATSLGDVQDVITLMQLERGRAPADDALTLLLQLKREIETLSTK